MRLYALGPVKFNQHSRISYSTSVTVVLTTPNILFEPSPQPQLVTSLAIMFLRIQCPTEQEYLVSPCKRQNKTCRDMQCRSTIGI